MKENNSIGFNISKRITYYRKLHGMSVNKLATSAGISQSYLRNLELNISGNPSVDTLQYICDALGITIRDFFDDDLFNTSSTDDLIKDIMRLNTEQKKILSQFIRTFTF